MNKNEVIQTAKAAAEVVLEFVKWYERQSRSVAYMKGEEPPAPRVVQQQQEPETREPVSNVAQTALAPVQELKAAKKPANQMPQLQDGDYYLKKGTITDGVKRVMQSFGWDGPFDTQGLNSFLRHYDIPNAFISDLLWEKEIKAGTLTSASAQTKLSKKLRGTKFFRKLEMDFIEQILPCAVREYRNSKRTYIRKTNVCGKKSSNKRDEPLLEKCAISSGMANLMKEHGWTGSFDCAGLKAFVKTKLPTLATTKLARLLFEPDTKGERASVSSVVTMLDGRYNGKSAFSVREMDRFVQILRELLPPSIVWRRADDDSILDGQNNVIAKNEDAFTTEKAEAVEKAVLSETGENGEPVIAEEHSTATAQPDLKQGRGRGNWLGNTLKRITAGF